MSTYRSKILNDAPTSYWKLDEVSGTTATDGTSIALNGAAGNYILAKSGKILSGLTNSTIEVWFKTSTATLMNIWEERASSGNDAFEMYLDTNGKPTFFIRNDAGTSSNPTDVTGFNDGKWHLFHVTKAGTALLLYIDGVNVQSGTWSGTETFTDAGIETRIGSDKANTANNFNGSLDEIACYSVALS